MALAAVRCFALAVVALVQLNAEEIPRWTLNLEYDGDVDLEPQAAYDACKVFFSLGGRHVNIPSNSTTWQLLAVAEALQNRRLGNPGSDVFISAELALPDLGYEKSVNALQRMLELLEISHFDLVLVGAGDSGCGEVCVSGSLAAAEHIVVRGGGVVGVSGWSLLQLQRMTPLFRKPLRAVKLEMDFLAASHLPVVKYCLAKHIPVTARWQNPGRLTGMVLRKNSGAEQVTFAAQLIAFDWMHVKSVSVALPHSMKDDEMYAVMAASDIDLSDMERRAGIIEQQFWPQWGKASLYQVSNSCPAGLEIDSALECENARKDLSLSGNVSPGPWKGCFLTKTCDSYDSDCETVSFGPEESTVSTDAKTKAICQKDAGAAGTVGGEVPQQGSTLFLAMCMGSSYFDRYCAPFFLSFLRIYGAPSSPSVRLRIWVMAVEHAQLRKARRLLRQLGHGLVDFDEGNFSALKEQWSQEHSGGVEDYLDETTGPISNRRTGCLPSTYHDNGITIETVCDPGVHDERMLINNANFFMWVIQQVKLPENRDFQYIVTIDSDMLFCKSLERFLPFNQTNGPEWDYAFTVYDREHEVPWGSNEEVAKTKNGHVRLNAGVQLFKNSGTLVPFLTHYLETIQYVLRWGHAGHGANEDYENPVAKLLEEFKAPNQAAIALIVGTSNLLYDDCEVCRHTLNLESNPELATTLGSFSLKVQALPMRYLNQAESLKNGEIPDDLHMLHLKGLWWRILVMEATAHPTETRCYHWNFEAYVYWVAMFRIWQPDYDASLTVLSDVSKCNDTSVGGPRQHPLV